MHYPHNEADLQTLIAQSPNIRAIGTGRSSADICAGPAELISLDHMPHSSRDIKIDHAAMTVDAPAGILLSTLMVELETRGWTLAALPDIDCISLGGAIATGTHGTGREALSLSDYVSGLRLILADGSILDITESSSDIPLDAVRVSLGLLGVVVRISLRIVPLYNLALIERPIRDAEWLELWLQLLAAHEFLRILWLPHTGWSTLITGDRYQFELPFLPQAAPDFHNQRRSISTLLYQGCARIPALTPAANHLIKKLFFESTVRKTGTLYETTVTKSRGAAMELAEWTIPFTRFTACFAELRRAMGRKGNYGHIPMDIRFIRKSSAWLANAWESDTVTVGCVSRTPYYADQHRIFRTIETIFLAHGGRPHWAKRFATSASTLDSLYPRLPDFRQLRRKLDPTDKFLNPWLESRFG